MPESEYTHIIEKLDEFRKEQRFELESINTQLRSIRETASANTTLYESRLVSLERTLEGLNKEIALRVQRADERAAFIDGEIKELTRHQGVQDAAMVLMDKELGAFKLAVKVVIGIFAAIGSAAETLLHWGHK